MRTAVAIEEPPAKLPVPGGAAIVPSAGVRPDVITVVIADDHALFREALRELLDDQADIEVIGEAADGRDAVHLARTLRPSIVLLNLHMPGMSGLEALAELSRVHPSAHALMVATQASDDEVVEALQLGARGVVMKHGATELLFKSIRMVAAGQYWVGRECVGGLIEQMQRRDPLSPFGDRDPSFGLTPRELELVTTVVDGCANNDIAKQLKISAKTVKHHLTKIYGKLGVANRLELALFAVQHRFRAGRFH